MTNQSPDHNFILPLIEEAEKLSEDLRAQIELTREIVATQSTELKPSTVKQNNVNLAFQLGKITEASKMVMFTLEKIRQEVRPSGRRLSDSD